MLYRAEKVGKNLKFSECKGHLKSGNAVPSDMTSICMDGRFWSCSTSAIWGRTSIGQASFDPWWDTRLISTETLLGESDNPQTTCFGENSTLIFAVTESPLWSFHTTAFFLEILLIKCETAETETNQKVKKQTNPEVNVNIYNCAYNLSLRCYKNVKRTSMSVVWENSWAVTAAI